jgi:hypothetical protein
MRSHAFLYLKAVICCGMGLVFFVLGGKANAQALSKEPAAPVATTGVQWSALSKMQQTALAPLSQTWPVLSDAQRRKWIAIAQNFSGLAEVDQQKLHSRMVEWAALTPKDREVARLNFAQTKSVAKPERAANWEAYQALPDEEKKKLAASAAPQPTGAALAVKPANRDKLTQVPVTRRTPEERKALVLPKSPLNTNTLLPQKPVTSKDGNVTDAAKQP